CCSFMVGDTEKPPGSPKKLLVLSPPPPPPPPPPHMSPCWPIRFCCGEMGLAWNELRPDPFTWPGARRPRSAPPSPLPPLLLEFGVSPLDGAQSGDVVKVPWLSPVPNPLLSYIPPELGVSPD